MTAVLVVLGILALAAAAAAIWLYLRQQRTERLKRGFGPEYQQAVQETGSRGRAERLLEERRRRIGALHIRPLTSEERDRFADEWQRTQAQFVDSPGEAVGEADRLIAKVMQARGYPVGDFEQRAADISVEHPAVVTHYRAAHSLALRQQQGVAETEDLRRALQHYRALVGELLGVDLRRDGHGTGQGLPERTGVQR